jgi:hypothetical protein
MSASLAVKPLRTLVGVRKRQQERLETSLLEQRRVLAERQAEVDAAQTEVQQCLVRENDNQAERQALLGSGFTPDKLVTLEHRQQVLAQATALARQGLQKHEKAVEQQHEVIRNVQRDIRRNAQRIDTFKQQIATILREREQAQEDTAEEEAEETSTARFCGRQRAAKENHDGL